MGFKFRFASLLRFALHEEDAVKQRLAIKDGQVAAEEASIRKVKTEIDIAVDGQSRSLISGNMDFIRLYPPYIRRLEKAREFHEDELVRLRQQREKILVELAEKRRVRRIYEKLRERDEKRYNKAELKRDQKRMDDFAGRGSRVASPDSRE